MEERKNHINIFNIIIIIILLTISGYLIYDKLTTKNENEKKIIKYESEIKELQKELNTQTNNADTNESDNTTTNQIDLLIGNWHYEETFKDGEFDCTATIKLELKEDGTYTYENGATCGGGTLATGNYSILKNKIYLQNDNCKSVLSGQECVYPNCKPIIELDYENNNILAHRIGGKIVSLKHD